jgi:vacuolar-type H+-ATPase subunit I/STV1
MENSKEVIQQYEMAAEIPVATATATTTTTTNDANKLKKFITSPHTTTSTAGTAMEYQKLDEILSRENRNNKMEIWSKLDKTQKILRLHDFAERYGQEHGFEAADVRGLKTFFVASLDKGKLQRVKDVIYDKEKREIHSIPALVVAEGGGTETIASLPGCDRHFTLRNLDTKRVSTLKSLGRGASKAASFEK